MSRVYATVFQPGQESVTLNVSKEKKKILAKQNITSVFS